MTPDAYAGCRLSDALALTAERVDLSAGTLVFEKPEKAPDRASSFALIENGAIQQTQQGVIAVLVL
jgi:hypothetical protein